jgi:hypothetical protein
MLRVGYPATITAELLRDFPAEVELVSLPDDLDHEIAIDVWLPDPYSTRAVRIWPHLRGVRLILSLMAGLYSRHAEILPALSRHAARGTVEAPI